MDKILLVYLVSSRVSDSTRFSPQAQMHILFMVPGARWLIVKSLEMFWLVLLSLMQPTQANSVPISKLHFRRSTIISVLLILSASTEQVGGLSASNYKKKLYAKINILAVKHLKILNILAWVPRKINK